MIKVGDVIVIDNIVGFVIISSSTKVDIKFFRDEDFQRLCELYTSSLNGKSLNRVLSFINSHCFAIDFKNKKASFKKNELYDCFQFPKYFYFLKYYPVKSNKND